MNNSKDKHGASQPEMKQVMNQPELTKQQVDTIISERGLVFIDPLSDFGFKRLLGSERNKEITLHLLNTFIGDDIGTITDISFIASEMVGFLPGKKKEEPLAVHAHTCG